jgi:hypothetical protein
MTTKQIAQAVGKAERTVHGWVAKASARFAQISVKVAEAKATSKPADYTLDESVQIIEIGMGKNAASLFRENGERGDGALDRMDRLESMVEKMCGLVATIVQTVSRPALPDIVQDYFTIKGYAGKLGQSVTYSEAVALGREARRISLAHGVAIRKADDERFGVVNSYSVDILRQVFEV